MEHAIKEHNENVLPISPWILGVREEFTTLDLPLCYQRDVNGFHYEIHNGRQSLWILAAWPEGGQTALRAAYSPEGEFTVEEVIERDESVEVRLSSLIGEHRVRLEFPTHEYLPGDKSLLHFTSWLKPANDTLIPFWPRDIIPLDRQGDPLSTQGVVHTSQVGPRSGMLYLSMTEPKSGSLMYFQNLTALNGYCSTTETSAADVVGGEWPELGFALPPAKKKPLIGGQEFVISDPYVCLSPQVPEDDFQMARQFLDMMAEIYLHLPVPETEYQDWHAIARKSLKDLEECRGCWKKREGQRYLNAYVGERKTPPESMVQMAVLMPLVEYEEWDGLEIGIIEELKAGLPNFYDEKVGSVLRWLIIDEDKLDGDEPHKVPRVMDSWYLYHSLLNLSRLALGGDKQARKLFLDSLDYAVKVAHHFDYKWPIFYNLDTLEVIRAESEPGAGGENDVAGFYALVMLQAWEITQEKRYLNEAIEAARSLKGLGFKMAYQLNNTIFASGAALRLWKETGDEFFRDLSYVCMANVFNHVWLWECDYGYGKNYPTFFSLFPLRKAEYPAAYEEIEAIGALQDYLARGGDAIPESLRLLTAELLRHLINKGSFCYPPVLPKEMLAEKSKSGRIDPELWLPLEDIRDGWEKSGQVGQQIYGAGSPFGIVSRQYLRVPRKHFMIFCDYPVVDFKKRDKEVSFKILGDERFSCRLRLIPFENYDLSEFTLLGGKDGDEDLGKGGTTPEGHQEFSVKGNQTITVSWHDSHQ